MFNKLFCCRLLLISLEIHWYLIGNRPGPLFPATVTSLRQDEQQWPIKTLDNEGLWPSDDTQSVLGHVIHYWLIRNNGILVVNIAIRGLSDGFIPAGRVSRLIEFSAFFPRSRILQAGCNWYQTVHAMRYYVPAVALEKKSISVNIFVQSNFKILLYFWIHLTFVMEDTKKILYPKKGENVQQILYHYFIEKKYLLYTILVDCNQNPKRYVTGIKRFRSKKVVSIRLNRLKENNKTSIYHANFKFHMIFRLDSD